MPPSTAVPLGEIGNRVDALAARIDQVASDKVDWKPQLEKAAELLRARIEHLEETVARYHDAEAVDVQGELAALASRIDAIPAPTDEWRSELANVAENLRTRIERVEQIPVGEQLAALRTALDGLVDRVDSLPTLSDEWRAATAELAGRMDSLAGSSDGWQTAIAELSSRIDSLPAPTEDWREAIAELSSRVDSLPAPADDWRDAIGAVEARVAELGQPSEGAGEDVRAALDALTARVDGLPQPSEEWRGEIASIREQIEQAGRSREADVGELLGLVDALGTRLDALPVDAWRPELAEVAENLRTRVERVEQRSSGSEETEQLRAELRVLAARVDGLPQPSEEWRELVAGLTARVEGLPRGCVAAGAGRGGGELAHPGGAGRTAPSGSEETEQLRAELHALEARLESLPQPSEEWRELVAGLTARIEGLPVDAWRPELAEVAENLRTRVERVEQRSSGSEETEQLRAELHALEARLESLPRPSEEWRSEIAGLREQIEQRATGSEETEQLRAGLQALEARLESLPQPSEEWRELVAGLTARIEGLPVDAWRPELAEVAENLRTRVERVEQRPTGSEELEALSAGLTHLAARLDSLPQPSEEWRDLIAQLATRVDAVTAEGSSSDALDTMRKRIERVEEGMNGQARAAAVTEIAEQVGELARKVAATDAEAVDQKLQTLAARPRRCRYPASGASLWPTWQRASTRSRRLRRSGASRSPLWPSVSTRYGRTNGNRSWRRSRGICARGSSGSSRSSAAITPSSSTGSGPAWTRSSPGSSRHPFTRSASFEPSWPSWLRPCTGGWSRSSSGFDTSGLESRLTESLSALVHERVEQFEVGGAEVKRRLDDALREIAAVGTVAGRVDEVESRLEAEGATAAGIAPQLDELKDAAGRQTRRIDKLVGRLDELASHRDATEVEQALGARLDATEGALGDLRDTIASLPGSVDERIAAAEARAAAAAGQALADVESLRRELDDLRAVVSTGAEESTDRIGAFMVKMQNDLSALAGQFVRPEAVDELQSAIAGQGAQIEGLGGRLISFERRIEENVAGRAAELTSELGALQARLESVEAALAGAGGWRDADAAAHARIESLENRLTETLSSEAVERNPRSRVCGAKWRHVSTRSKAPRRNGRTSRTCATLSNASRPESSTRRQEQPTRVRVR